MTRRTPWNHSPTCEAKTTSAVIKGQEMLAEFAQQFDVFPNEIT